MFPYCKIPKFSHNFSQRKGLEGQDLQKFIAFNCLFVIDSRQKQGQLFQMAKILLKQDFANLPRQKLTGQKIFTLYYIKQLKSIINQLNANKLTQQKKLYCLQILSNLLPQDLIKRQISRLDEKVTYAWNINTKSLYLKTLVKNQLPYIHIVDQIHEQLQKRQQTIKSQTQSLEGSKILLSIQNYNQILPSSLVNKCLEVIIKNIDNLTPIEHITIIKFIYLDSSALCKKYAQSLTSSIFNVYKQQQGEQLHIPLILKLIKYRSKLRLDNKLFSQIIQAYPQKFNTVFKQKDTNKEIFMSLLTKQSNKTMNYQIKSQFGSFITKTFEEYQRIDQIDEEKLMRNMKLILKFGNQLKKEQVQTVVNSLVNGIYQRCQDLVSDELKYYMFLVLYTFDYSSHLKNQNSFVQILKDVTNLFNKKATQNPTSDHITKAINIQYQLCRKQSQTSIRINVFKYNYQNIDLSPRVYSYLFYLMTKQLSSHNQKQIIKVLNQCKKNIYKNLSSGNFSIKIIYTLIDVLDKLKFDDKYLYKDIEKGIQLSLRRSLEEGSKKLNQIPLPKDIFFLKLKLAEKERCSKKFNEFIYDAQKNYDLIKDHINVYLQKATNYEKMRQNYKNNRKKQQEKNNQPKNKSQ